MRFRPIYRLVIGAAEIDVIKDVSASTVVRLDVERDMEAHTDRFELRLAPLGGIQPAEDDDVKIELGFDTTLNRVFTGKVTEVVSEVTTLRVVGLSTMLELEALRLDKTYEVRTAGEIVKDLAGQAGVDTGVVEDGIFFPFYVIDGRLSAARHVHRLAGRCGFDVYVLPTGELEFRQFTKSAADHVFTYGQDVLDFSLTARPERASEVVVFGESPASAEGDDAASWLTKNFQQGQATGGGGPETVLVQDPAIRTTDAADLRAEGVLRRSRQRARIGTLRALGRPEVKLGDAIRIEQAPDDRLNDVFQVRAVYHRLSRRVGLVTEISFWGLP
jgi:phage protein D